MKLHLFAAAVALAVLAPRFAAAEAPIPEKEFAATPDDAWAQFQKALGRHDKNRMWALLSRDSRELLETQIGAQMQKIDGEPRKQLAEMIGVTEEEYDKMTAKDLVMTLIVVKAGQDKKHDISTMKVHDIAVRGDKAEGKRDEAKDLTHPAYFVREDGEWKLDLKRELEAVTEKQKAAEGTTTQDASEQKK